MDGDITKRMGVNIGKAFTFGEGDEGRRLHVYQMGAGTEGRYFSGEAGGSGRYTIGETGVNRLAGAEVVDTVHKASEVSSE